MLDEITIEKIAEARKKYGRIDLTLRVEGEFLIATLSAKDFMLSLIEVNYTTTNDATINELYMELLEVLDKTAIQKPVVQITKHDEFIGESSEVICESCGKPISGYHAATTFVPASRVIDISQERFASNYCADCYITAASTRKRKV